MPVFRGEIGPVWSELAQIGGLAVCRAGGRYPGEIQTHGSSLILAEDVDGVWRRRKWPELVVVDGE